MESRNSSCSTRPTAHCCFGKEQFSSACVVVLVSSVSPEVGLCSYQCYQHADNWSRAKLASYYELCIYLFQLFTLNISEGTKV